MGGKGWQGAEGAMAAGAAHGTRPPAQGTPKGAFLRAGGWMIS